MTATMQDVRNNYNSGFCDALVGEPYDAKNNRFVGYAEGYDRGECFKDEFDAAQAEGFELYFETD